MGETTPRHLTAVSRARSRQQRLPLDMDGIPGKKALGLDDIVLATKKFLFLMTFVTV